MATIMTDTESKVSIGAEMAAKEVKEWLDFKRIDDDKKIKLAGNILSMTTAVMKGMLTINPETKVITHKLKFPIGAYTELTYKARLSMADIQTRTQHVKQNDLIEVSMAYGAALTGVSSETLKLLDTEDFSLLDRIAFFFMD